jgi:peptidyl-prolyl cis-trans isomerase SurA
MNVLSKLLFTLVAFWLISPSFGQESTTNGQVIDKIIAKVDNNILLESEVQKTYVEALAQAQQGIEPPTRCQVFESLVVNKLMVAKAEIDSVLITDAEVTLQVENRFNQVMQQFGGDEAVLAQAYGKTGDQLRSELQDVIREQLIVNKMRGKITEGVAVSPAEVKQFYNSIQRDSLPFFSA